MIKTHYKEFFTFAIIGVVNTLVHSSIVIVFVEKLMLNPTFANTIAFFIANIASFFMNAHFTFKLAPTLKRYKRFFLASLSTLILTILLSSFAEFMHWHYLIGLALVILAGPILTFILQKKWAFAKGQS